MEITTPHRLHAYVNSGWPANRLLWLAAALDWGPTPTSLQGLQREQWRQAQRRLYPGSSLHSEQWWLLSDGVCARDDWKCNACRDGDNTLEVDHIQSLSRGGSNEPDNLWAPCTPCHAEKTRMARRVNWLDLRQSAKFRGKGGR